MNKRLSSGFTLVELLITVAIIATLVAVAIPAYSNFVSKGRDSKRNSDLKTLQSALVQYRADLGSYPSTLTAGLPLTNEAKTKTYLRKVPADPLSAYDYPQYSYAPKPEGCNNTAVRCAAYCLYANLEDANAINRQSACPDRYEYNLELPSP